MKSIRRDENDPIGSVAAQTSAAFETILITQLAAMKTRGYGNGPHLLYVTAMAIGTAMNIAAKLITSPEDEEEADKWAETPCSRAAILVASLLVARCTKPGQGCLDFEFGPRHVLAAMLEAEKITGHSNDAILSRGMVEAARQQELPTHFFDNSEVAATVDLSQHRTLN